MDKKHNPPKRVWKEVIDPSSRSVYYWNVLTGDTSWENPYTEDTCPLSPNQKISHDTKVIIDKLDNKVDRIKFFFDEINLINEVCDHVYRQEIDSVKELIESSLTDLNEILDIATPKTRAYNKFLDLKKFLNEQKSNLKNNDQLSEDVVERIKDLKEEILQNLENLKRYSINTDEIVDHYKVYVDEKKGKETKLDLAEQKEAKESILDKQEQLSHDKVNLNKGKQDKKKVLKSIHERWSRASEIIDEADEDFKQDVKKQKPNDFINTEENNPNFVPITKPWYQNLD